jgi:hypothetical protein
VHFDGKIVKFFIIINLIELKLDLDFGRNVTVTVSKIDRSDTNLNRKRKVLLETFLSLISYLSDRSESVTCDVC